MGGPPSRRSLSRGVARAAVSKVEYLCQCVPSNSVAAVYPSVIGNEVVFSDSGSDDCDRRVVRRLRPLVLCDVEEQEYGWLTEHAKARMSVDCGYQGVYSDDYDLVYNSKTRNVAIRWQGRLWVRPEDTIAVRFYDALTNEIERLRKALDCHRRGLDSGWGDAEVLGERVQPDGPIP